MTPRAEDLLSTAEEGTGGRALRAYPVLCAAFFAAALLVGFHLAGMAMNGDMDDVLKLVEIRHLLHSVDIFDRTIPGIAQPEPYVTHWPWIVDLPYALAALPLQPVLGPERALSVAAFCVPLLLLLPALYAYHRLIVLIGFERAWALLPLLVLFAMRTFFEFAPGRVDYHNLQITLLLVALVLLCTPGLRAAAMNGVLTALALAISLEFAAFYLLVLAVQAADFLWGRDPDGRGLAAFGTGLAGTAGALFVAIVPPAEYGMPRCDTYSSPQTFALAAAGLSFLVAGLLGRQRGLATRIALICVPGLASIAALVLLFPQCLSGPYGAVSDYVRINQLAQIVQERSLFALSDFVLSPSMLTVAVLLVGALALPMIAASERAQSRPRLIVGLAALVAVVQAVAYFRYLRYLPIFSGIGFVFIVQAVLPAASSYASMLRSSLPRVRLSAAELAMPGFVVTALIFGWNLFWPTAPDREPAAKIADGCTAAMPLSWPQGARLLSPPVIGLQVLAGTHPPEVVSIPNHPASLGIERAYRFLDPDNTDPHAILLETAATHVAVCAWPATDMPQAFVETYPLAAALMSGKAPEWLKACPLAAGVPLRVYAGTGAACPLAADQVTTSSIR